MASAYELVAATRPRIRRDTLFTKTAEGVLFHNAHGGFRIDARTAYQVTSVLVPHLNGRNQVAEICRSLTPQQREMVGEMVKALYDRGFARDVPPEADRGDLPAPVAERFSAQIAYVDHHVDRPASRFQGFRETRVAVLGTGEVARWCVTGLARNGCAAIGLTPGVEAGANRFDAVLAEIGELAEAGCPVELTRLPGAVDTLGWAQLAGWDVVVVAAGPAAPACLLRLLAEGVPEGVALLPAWTIGARAVVGPLTTDGSTGCWVCAALRLSANGAPEAAARLWQGASLPHAAPAFDEPTGSVAAMLGNLLAYEIFRLRTGALPAETAGKVVIQNLDSFDVLAEALLAHPGCPHCHGGATPQDPAEVRAEVRAVAAALAVADRVPGEPRQQTLAGAEADAAADALVAELGERMLLFGRHAGVFNGYTDEPWTQLPLKVSTVRLAAGHRWQREIVAFDVHHVAGARRRALHAAAGVYTEHVRRAAAGPAAGPAARVDPARLATASGANFTGDGFTGDGAGGWVETVSLFGGQSVLVPAAAVVPFGPENAGQQFTPTRAGTGAGASLAEAVAQGLLSALGHLALTTAVRGAPRPSMVELDAVGDPELTFLVKSAHNLGVQVELLDLGAGCPGGAHVLLARTAAGEGTPAWRIAAHLSWQHAAVAALRDLVGWTQLARELGDDRPVVDGDPILADLDAGTLVSAGQVPAREQAAVGLGGLLDGLRDAGYDVLVADTTPADLRAGGVATARVLVVCP